MDEKITIAKAVTINGTSDLYEALGKTNNNITRHFLKNQTAIRRTKIEKALGKKLYIMLINGEIDLITYHVLDKHGEFIDKIEILQEYYYN